MWQEYGSEWTDDGNPGGDWQVGKACSRRFHNPEIPGALVTVYYYPGSYKSEDDDESETFELDVECQTEFMICKDIDDPGGTQEWCTYTYNKDVYDNAFDSVEKAEAAALSALRRFDPVRDIHWDGKPFG